MKTCVTCQHWRPLADPMDHAHPAAPLVPGRWNPWKPMDLEGVTVGVCEKMVVIGATEMPQRGAAVVVKSGEHDPHLVTDQAFGCTMHEEKP